MKNIKIALLLAIPLLFLLFQILTIKDYGISWDEPIHFTRGQAYLQYFLKGEKDYKNFNGTRSYFQDDSQNGYYFLENDSGHPPINDIFAALTNKIFYQKLHIVGDIEGYHLFNIICSTILVFVIIAFTYQTLGIIPAVFSGIIVSTYPFLFAESHFNIKDPPQAAFYALTIWLFWMSLKKFDWRLLLGSLIACGLSLGMKLNILFLPFILIPYLFLKFRKSIPKIPRSYLMLLIFSPLIVFFIFLIFWPFLWQDLVGNLLKVFEYYKQIGTGASYQSKYLLPGGFNIYPLFWIIATTPPSILIFLLIGLVSYFYKNNSKEKYEYLWLIWFLVPILRVSIPGSSIYGGIRQIFEFFPAMILISSKGFLIFINTLIKIMKKRSIVIGTISLLLILFFNAKILIDYHPNQNVYFNLLVGGLKGAKEKNIPYWGNSFGNAYLQAIKWINNNVENNSKLALIQGTGTNLPKIQLRKDIYFSNLNWSGIYRSGEYLVELTHQDPMKMYPYAWNYVDNFLIPVHEIKVDGVAIAKVWKNSFENTKEQVKLNEVSLEFSFAKNMDEILIDLKEEKILTRIYFYIYKKNCGRNNAKILTSTDKVNWLKEEEDIPVEQVTVKENNNDLVPYFFAGTKARFIKIIPFDKDSCLFNTGSARIYYLNK